jgi:cytochrome c oxidase subunit 1
MVSSIGAYIAFAGTLVFLFALLRAFTSGQKCADNPWGEGATTLEWTVTSPPPYHSFDELPVVK